MSQDLIRAKKKQNNRKSGAAAANKTRKRREAEERAAAYAKVPFEQKLAQSGAKEKAKLLAKQKGRNL